MFGRSCGVSSGAGPRVAAVGVVVVIGLGPKNQRAQIETICLQGHYLEKHLREAGGLQGSRAFRRAWS